MPPKRFSRVSASMPHEKREKFDKKLEKMGLNRNVFINTKIEEFINEQARTARTESPSGKNAEGNKRLTITIDGEEYYY